MTERKWQTSFKNIFFRYIGDYNCECNKGYDSANPKAMQCKGTRVCRLDNVPKFS